MSFLIVCVCGAGAMCGLWCLVCGIVYGVYIYGVLLYEVGLIYYYHY